jgi:hypothetical protein
MAGTNFPVRARRDDPNGHMTVQTMLEFLRDAFDKHVGKFASGSVSIPNGQTTAVVTHAFGSPSYHVTASPVNGDCGSRWWIDLKTSTQFTLRLQTTPSVVAQFDWQLKGV